jgi:hypothetical protein
MFLVATLAVALVAGWVRGGRLRNVAELQLRYAWLPLSLFLLQAILVLFPVIESERMWRLGPLVLVSSYAALVAFLFLNRSLPGAKLILLGTALNLSVVLANGGYMPVTPEALQRSGHEDRVVVRGDGVYVLGSKDVVLDLAQTRLWPLSDILGIPKEAPFSASFSLGDVAVALGAFVLVYQAVLGQAADPGARIRLRQRRKKAPRGTIEERSDV